MGDLVRDKLRTEPDVTKVRIIAEYLWRRLEQIYEGKLQTWKQNEEKMIEEMIARLRRQYRQNLLLKEKELEELVKRKEDECRNKEDFLREDIRLTFENKKLECERAWRKIEMAQKELRFQKESLANARADFQSRKDNELFFIEQERSSLEKIKDSLKLHERNFNQRMREAIRKGRERDRIQLTQLIFKWNKKEAVLSRKYEIVLDKIHELSSTEQFSTTKTACLKKVQEKVIQQQQKLAETKQALNDALHKQDKTNEELEHIKKEKSKLSETNRQLKESLEGRSAKISSLKKQLQLLEESAALRINELKLQHKLAADKLQMLSRELYKYHHNALEKSDRFSSHRTTRMSEVDSSSSSTLTDSSFEQNFRDRMKILNSTKQELDVALDKLRVRSHSPSLDYTQSISLLHAETNQPEKQLPRNSSSHEIKQRQRNSSIKTNPTGEEMTETQGAADPVSKDVEMNMEVGLKKSLSEKHAIDPLMVQYMEMIQNQSEKVEQLLEQAPKENNEPSETFIIETGEGPDTPSDFGW